MPRTATAATQPARIPRAHRRGLRASGRFSNDSPFIIRRIGLPLPGPPLNPTCSVPTPAAAKSARNTSGYSGVVRVQSEAGPHRRQWRHGLQQQVAAAHRDLEAGAEGRSGEQVRVRSGIEAVPAADLAPHLGVPRHAGADRVIRKVDQSAQQRDPKGLCSAPAVETPGVGEHDDADAVVGRARSPDPPLSSAAT